jgi:hypothetical protein
MWGKVKDCPLMPRAALSTILALSLAFSGAAAFAQEANLTTHATGAEGSATRLVVAQDAYELALISGDAILLLAAIRMARGISVRAPTGWEKTSTGEAAGEASAIPPAAPDPASDKAIQIVQGLAGEDPDLQDLVYDLDAQLPQGDLETAVVAQSALEGGQTDSWRMPLSGSVLTEIGLIGNGDSALALAVADDAGNPVCVLPPGHAASLCRFTPARNGFFVVTVQNSGAKANSYRLIGN